MNIIQKKLSSEVVAVGVSGGRDSMALVHMLNATSVKIVALTVDHDLRPESRAEAEQVGIWMHQFGFEHHILTWQGKKPSVSIEDEARKARYRLLTDYCKQNNINTLAIAHHMDDQIETFLFRLTKGSGLDGLSGMAEEKEINSIKIIRPLLNTPRNEISDYCAKNNIPYVDDPMNESDDYTRVRFRKFLQSEGLDAGRLNRTISRLSRAADALEIIAENAYLATVTQKNNNELLLEIAKWQEFHPEIQIRIIQKIIRAITGDFFAGRLAKIEEALLTFSALKNGKSFAIGGVLFTKTKSGLKALLETR